MRAKLALGASLFACFLPATNSAAQSNDGAPPLLVSEDDRLPDADGVDIGVQGQVAYLQNFLQLADGVPEPSNLSKDDVVSSFGGYIAARETISLQQVYVSGFINRREHANNSQYNNYSAAGRAGWAWKVGTACDGTVEGLYNRGQGDFADEGSFVKNIRETRSLKVSGQCPLANILTPGITYSTLRQENSAVGRQQLDYESEGIGIDLALARTNRLVIALAGERNLWTYLRRPGEGGVGSETVERLSAGGRIAYNPTGRLSLSAGLAANRVTREGDGQQRQGITGNAAIRLMVIPRFNIALSTRRIFEPSRFVIAGYQRRDLLDARFAYSISPRTNVTLRGVREMRRYYLPSAGPLQRRRDEIYVAQLLTRYRLTSSFLIDGEIRYDSRSLDNLAQNIDAMRISLSVQVAI